MAATQGRKTLCVPKCMRPEDLPFPVPENVARAVDVHRAACARDDLCLGLYRKQLRAEARSLPDDLDGFIQEHCGDGGW